MTDAPEQPAASSAQTRDVEALKAQKKRNMWLGLALAAFVVIVGLITFVRLSESDLSQGGFYYSVDAENEGDGTLPPGMSADEAVAPPNLSAAPEPVPEEEAPE